MYLIIFKKKRNIKTKTKLIALLLCLPLAAAALTGCGSSERLQDKLDSDDYSVYTEPQDDDNYKVN